MKILYLFVGVVVGYFLGRRSSKNKLVQDKDFIKEEVLSREEQNEEIDKIILDKMAQSQEKRITNDEVEELLGVADSTATKYLQRLEDQGKITQQGETGRSVYYVLK